MNETETREVFSKSASAMPVGPSRDVTMRSRSRRARAWSSNAVILGGALAVVIIVSGVAVLGGTADRIADVASPGQGTSQSSDSTVGLPSLDCAGDEQVESFYEGWGAQKFFPTAESVAAKYVGPRESLALVSDDPGQALYAIRREDESVRAVVNVERVDGDGWFLAASVTCPGDTLR